MKEILRRLGRESRQVKENIYRSAWNVNTDYLPPAAGAKPSLPDRAKPGLPDRVPGSHPCLPPPG
jgi:hypothetical protein